MEKKILYLISGILLLSTVALAIHIIMASKYDIRAYDIESESLYIESIYNRKLWGTNDAVPNEETAKKIAGIIMDKQLETKFPDMAIDLDMIYDVTIEFYEGKNEWMISYIPKVPVEENNNKEIILCIRKNNGKITNLTELQ